MVFAGVLAFENGAARAQVDPHQAAAIALIRQTAVEMCTTPPLEQKSQTVSLTGKAQAQLAGVTAKVAHLGVEGSGNLQRGSSSGVLQKDLANAIKAGNDCKLAVLTTLSAVLFQRPRPVSRPVAAGKAPAVLEQAPPTAVHNIINSQQGGSELYEGFVPPTAGDMLKVKYDCTPSGGVGVARVSVHFDDPAKPTFDPFPGPQLELRSARFGESTHRTYALFAKTTAPVTCDVSTWSTVSH